MSKLLTLEREIDPQVWRACAGTAACIPATGSTVYYFPKGHAEQSSSMPDFSSIPHRSWFTLCRVTKIPPVAEFGLVCTRASFMFGVSLPSSNSSPILRRTGSKQPVFPDQGPIELGVIGGEGFLYPTELNEMKSGSPPLQTAAISDESNKTISVV